MPARERIVRVAGARIFVRQTGQGTPALLLHGVPDSAELWRPLSARLQDSYDCHMPDLPGFHRSGLPAEFDYRLDAYADFVAQLADALDLHEPFTLIAHDWGAIFGLAFACKYPERLRRFVGGSAPFSHLYRWHFWARVWRTPVLGELAMLAMNRGLYLWEMRRGSRRLTREQILETYAPATRWDVRWHVLKLYRSLPPAEFLVWGERLTKLATNTPLDYVWGAKDPYVPPHLARLMHGRSVTSIADCGHWVPVEAPDDLARVILTPPDS